MNAPVQLEIPGERLPVHEKKRLEQLEGVIQRNLKGFFAVGMALREIQEKALYRETHRRFEDYVRDNFNVTRMTAHRQIKAAKVVENVTNWLQSGNDDIVICQDKIAEIPLNESQVRPLANLKPEDQVKVWQTAVKTAPNGKVTAKHVQRTIFDVIDNNVPKKLSKIRKETKKEEKIDPRFKEAFEELILRIEEAKAAKYKTTSRDAVIRHLDALRQVIAGDGTDIIPDKGCKMVKSDRQKLISAGYKIIRKNSAKMLIEEQGENGDWQVFGIYKTHEELDCTFGDMVQDDNNLRG